MEMIIFIGLQAAGKSTFYFSHFATTHVHISKDLFRHHKRPAIRQQHLIEEALRQGQSVVIDNTNATLKERELLIEQGHSYGATVIGYYFESSVRQSLERNKQRIGKARVPDVAIFATIKRLVPPTYKEGFDKLYYVRAIGDGKFEITDWKE